MLCSVAKQTCKKRVNERSGVLSLEMVTKLKLDLLLLVVSVLSRSHCATIGALRQEKNLLCARLVRGSKMFTETRKMVYSSSQAWNAATENRTLQNDQTKTSTDL